MAVKPLELEDLSREGFRSFKFRNLANTDMTDAVLLGKGIKAMRVFAYTASGSFNVDVYASPNEQNNKHIKLGAVTQAAPTLLVPGPVGYSFRFICTAAAQPVDVFAVVEEAQ